MRTLVVHTGGIGDFLLLCPALARLASDGPLDLLGRRNRLELAVAGGIARAAHDLSSVDFESIFVEPSPLLHGFLSSFDRCIVWMRDDGTILRALRGYGVPDPRVFSGLPPADWRAHASQYYLHCLGFEDAPPLRLPIPPAGTQYDVVIHPGSGSPKKNWPLDRFDAVWRHLRDRGRVVTWLRGPAEEDMRLPARAQTLKPESLLVLAQVLAASRRYIGNDSGVSHLAAAVGCPTLAIFGPTDPQVWGPRGDTVTILQGDPWPEVEDVLAHL